LLGIALVSAAGFVRWQVHATWILTDLYSPYTEAPVRVFIGADKVVHFVPRHLMPESWLQDAELHFPSLEAEIGHTLVHFLYTGVYATLHVGARTPAVQLRQALRVYVAASTYALPELRRLAMRDLERHAELMELPEVIEVFRDDFEKVPFESDLHVYLLRKITAAFNNDRTIFKSEKFFENPSGATLTKFAMQKAMALFLDEMSKMQQEIISLRHRLEKGARKPSLQHFAPEHNPGTRRECIAEDIFAADESTASSSSTEEWASPTDKGTDWSGATLAEDIGVNIGQDTNVVCLSPAESGWEEVPVPDVQFANHDVPTLCLHKCLDIRTESVSQ
jgi:hypothetical protein